jgi:predicted AAA+ superfamily ATPase
MGYSFKNSKGKTYFLHTKDVILKGGREQTIYYFAKDERSNTCDLPAGKKIVENEKTAGAKKSNKNYDYYFGKTRKRKRMGEVLFMGYFY